MQDWCKNLTFFQKGLARAGWAGKTPHLQELLHLVGVVVTNSFGIYSNNCPQASTPHTVPSSSVSSDCSAGALQSSENGGLTIPLSMDSRYEEHVYTSRNPVERGVNIRAVTGFEWAWLPISHVASLVVPWRRA